MLDLTILCHRMPLNEVSLASRLPSLYSNDAVSASSAGGEASAPLRAEMARARTHLSPLYPTPARADNALKVSDGVKAVT